MSDNVVIAIAKAAETLPGAIASVAAAYFAYRAATTAKASLEVSKHTEANTNHLKDELVALTAKSSHAEGLLQGQTEAIAKTDDKT